VPGGAHGTEGPQRFTAEDGPNRGFDGSGGPRRGVAGAGAQRRVAVERRQSLLR